MIDPNIVNLLLVLILIIGFLIRLPFNNLPIDEDFGMFTYPAYFRERGIQLGRDFWISFPPVMFCIYIFIQKVLGNSVKHIRIFSNCYNLLNIFAIFLVTNYLFGHSEALAAALIYAVFSASPYLGTYSCHAEGFYILPLALGIFAIAHGITDHQVSCYIWGGCLMATAFLLKIVNIVYWISFTMYLLFMQLYEDILYFTFSFFAVIALITMITAFIFRGHNLNLWNQNQMRTKVCLNFIHENLKNNYKFDIPPIVKETGSLFLLSLLFLMYLFFIERSIEENILIIWTLSTLIILTFQRVYLMYHFIPVVQSVSVLSGLAIYKFSEISTIYPYYLSLSAIFLFTLLIAFNIYQKVRFFILYKKDKKLPYFQKGDQFFFIPEIAKHIRNNTSSDDYMYVWGPFVQIYRLADRRSCEGYVFHFVRPYKKWNSIIFDEILNGIISKKPVYIALIRPDFDMKVLEQITGLHYDLERVFFNRYPLYRLKGTIARPLNINNMTREEKIDWLELLTPGSMYYKLNETYIRSGSYKKAEYEYREALKLKPNDSMAKLGLAALMRIMGNYEEALKLQNQVAEYDKKQEWYRIEKGITLEKMGKYDEAIRELQEEEKFFPGKAETAHILGIVYGKQKRYDDALRYLEEAIIKKPEMEWVRLDKGFVLSDMKKYEEAMAEFEKEECIFPNKADTKYGLGVVYKHLRKHENALMAFHEALAINPSFSFAKYNINSILENTGNREKAKKGYLKMISSNSMPASLKGSCFFHLGKMCLQEDRIETAENYFKKCLEFIPEHSEAGRCLNALMKTQYKKK